MLEAWCAREARVERELSVGQQKQGEPHQAPLIAHVIFNMVLGGLENGLVNLINRMPERRYRHAIIFIKNYSDFRTRIERADVEVIALHKREGTDLSVYTKLFRELRRLRPAIVHSRNVSGLDSLLPARLAGVPCRIHSEHGWDVWDIDGSNRKYQRLRKVHKPLIDHHIAPCPRTSNTTCEIVSQSRPARFPRYTTVWTRNDSPRRAAAALAHYRRASPIRVRWLSVPWDECSRSRTRSR